MAEARQSNAQIKMSQRKKMLQTYREQRLLRGFFVATLAQAHDGQSQMRLGTVAIDFERVLKGPVGIVGALLTQISFANTQMQIGQVRIGALGLQQTRQRRIHISLFKMN